MVVSNFQDDRKLNLHFLQITIVKLPFVTCDFLVGGKTPVRTCLPKEYTLNNLFDLQDLQYFNFIIILLK